MSKRKPTKPASLYSVHPGVVMAQKWITELPEKSGKSLDQWVALIKKQKFTDQKGAMSWLKSQHALGTNTAGWLAQHAFGDPAASADSDPAAYLAMAERYVEALYSGAKGAIRPLHDALLDLALQLGPDAKACPCKTIVPIYRSHVIAQIKPTTRTRIDLGLALAKHTKVAKGTLPKRLIDTGGMAKNDRITHRVEISAASNVDDFVRTWLREAYELDAPGTPRQ